VKERGILFSAPMVRALLDGRKTQTRRLVNRQGPHFHERAELVGRNLPGLPTGAFVFVDACGEDPVPVAVRCPYGEPGDRLWVKETFGFLAGNGLRTVYRADGDPPARSDGSRVEGMKWRPSIFMPRRASRLTLRIESVRVQRLQSISEKDARAEGATRVDFGATGGVGIGSYAQAYRTLWSSLHGPESWAANPWVWVLDFKKEAP
jgi:hypothetical protein